MERTWAPLIARQACGRRALPPVCQNFSPGFRETAAAPSVGPPQIRQDTSQRRLAVQTPQEIPSPRLIAVQFLAFVALAVSIALAVGIVLSAAVLLLA